MSRSRHCIASPLLLRLPRRPLALGLGALLGCTSLNAVPNASARPAGTLLVTNCADDGDGSLRAAVASAVSGDTIGFSTDIGCSQITLTSGAIVIANGSDSLPLTAVDIVGPGRNALTINGDYLDRVLVHQAGTAGVLTLSGVKLTHGFTGANGGCILAYGNVQLTDVELSECGAGIGGSGATVRGGGLYAAGSATLDSSFVGDNQVYAQGGYAYGAGVFAAGDVTLTATTISGNFAHSSTGGVYGGGLALGNRDGAIQATLTSTNSQISNNSTFSVCDVCPVRGGGVWIYGNSTFNDSVISGNSAFSAAQYGAGGGLYFKSAFGGLAVTATLIDTDVSSNSADNSGGAIGAGGLLAITRGTISGINATGDGGAIALFGESLQLADSTITGNIAGGRGGGIFVFGYGDVATSNSTLSYNMAVNGGAIANTYGSLHLDNSTLAFNTASSHGGGVYLRYAYYVTDLQSTIVAGNTASSAAEDFWPPGMTVTGANNLIVAAPPGVTLPTDTLTADPLLQPLANNGGRTMTHALGEDSPAIDAGNNLAGLDFDQRGEGFVRVAGTAPDIGAYEVQDAGPSDVIFANGFDN
jgi:hypothetical protein